MAQHWPPVLQTAEMRRIRSAKRHGPDLATWIQSRVGLVYIICTLKIRTYYNMKYILNTLGTVQLPLKRRRKIT